MGFDARAVAQALGGEARGNNCVVAPGPGHSPRDRSLSVLLDGQAPDGFAVNSFAGDDPIKCRDYVRERLGLPSWRPGDRRGACGAAVRPESGAQERIAENPDVFRILWRKRLPIAGTIAETYLREARAYGGQIAPTLGFLPARGKHGPAMIAAFGLADETEPGVISIAASDVRGVHLTKLLPDGSGKIDAPGSKIIVGSASCGFPIVLAPPNDLLSLAITEGIEDGLSVYEATGLGVWVAGCASRLPALADKIPRYIETVTIVGDDDDAGRRFGRELVRRLGARGLRSQLKFLRSPESCAA